VCIGKRLREAKNNTKQTPQKAETQRMDDTQHDDESHAPVSSAGPHLVSHHTISPSFSNGLLPFDIGNFGPCFTALASLSVPTPIVQPQFPLTVFGALYINGQILGLSCGTTVPAKSTPASPDVPFPLHPTDLQLVTIHSRWIDRFPFPKMRDNLISLSGVMDDEELLRDICTMPSFTITPGQPAWEPRAWIMEPPFAEKWGYLMF